jgi:predicted nucleic acid-binding protein
LGLLIDSSILITLERTGRSAADLRQRLDDDFAISAVTLSEIMVGLHRAQSAAQRMRRQGLIDRSLETLPVLPFDADVAVVHARIWAELLASGQPIGVQDSLIAATALTHGYAVLTDNVRDFERIPGLEVRQPDW